MPKFLDKWQVFPNRGLEKLEPNLWRVEGDIPFQKGTRVMTVAKLADGGLLIHNAIALDEPGMAELETFGKPSVLVVPGSFHRLDSKIWKDRYPDLKVATPAGAQKATRAAVPVDMTYAEFKDPNVRLTHLDGCKETEGTLEVTSPGSATVVFNDSVNNMKKMGGLFGFILAPTGQVAVPRIFRWMNVKDKRAFTAHLSRLAATPNLKRIIFSHGKMIDQGASDALRKLAAEPYLQ